MLFVENLSKVYQKKETIKAVDHLSFSVEKGTLVGFLGPNGAGKTTTVKMLCGLIVPDYGRIEINGYSPWHQRKEALKNISAVLEGNRNIYWPLTVKENMEFFAALHGKVAGKIRSRISDTIEMLGLKDKTNTPARSLSRGMQQKLAFGVSLIKDSPLIILDEPTLGLDVEATLEIRALLKKLVREEGKTILITTHDMHLVEDVCQRAIIINNGKIVADEKVDNILQFFSVKAYKLNIQGKLSAHQKLDLLKLVNITAQEVHDQTTIHINLQDNQLLYVVMEILRRENLVIEAINREEVDFEKVFLQIVKEGIK